MRGQRDARLAYSAEHLPRARDIHGCALVQHHDELAAEHREQRDGLAHERDVRAERVLQRSGEIRDCLDRLSEGNVHRLRQADPERLRRDMERPSAFPWNVDVERQRTGAERSEQQHGRLADGFVVRGARGLRLGGIEKVRHELEPRQAGGPPIEREQPPGRLKRDVVGDLAEEAFADLAVQRLVELDKRCFRPLRGKPLDDLCQPAHALPDGPAGRWRAKGSCGLVAPPSQQVEERGRDFADLHVADDGGLGDVLGDSAPTPRFGELVELLLPGGALGGQQSVHAHPGARQGLTRRPDLGAEERGELPRRDPGLALDAVVARDNLPPFAGQRRAQAGEVIQVVNADDHPPLRPGGDDHLHRLVPKRRLAERGERNPFCYAVQCAQGVPQRQECE